MNGTWGRHTHMAWYSSRRRELAKEVVHPHFILRHLRINLGVCSFQVDIRQQRRASMPWSCQIDHIYVVILDQPIQMDINETEPRRCSPMSKESRLDMFRA